MYLFFFFPSSICPIFSFLLCCLLPPHSITLKPFLLRPYQHMSGEVSVPIHFYTMFSQSVTGSQASRSKNQGVKLKTPDWPPPHINLQRLPEPPGLIKKSFSVVTAWEPMKRGHGAMGFAVAFLPCTNRLIYKWSQWTSVKSQFLLYSLWALLNIKSPLQMES